MIDTRNDLEVAMGTLRGAVIRSSRASASSSDYAARELDPDEASQDRDVLHRRHPLREGESPILLAQGFDEVYHLKGGILKYPETIPRERQPLARRMLRVRRACRARAWAGDAGWWPTAPTPKDTREARIKSALALLMMRRAKNDGSFVAAGEHDDVINFAAHEG